MDSAANQRREVAQQVEAAEVGQELHVELARRRVKRERTVRDGPEAAHANERQMGRMARAGWR